MKIKLSTLNLKTIEDCFKTDKEFCKKWHVEAPATAKECAKRTFEDLKTAQLLKWYVIKDGRNIVGFFGNEGNTRLSSFFIKPKYRPANKELFEMLIQNLEKPFISGVYNKNIPALKWLQKMGGNAKHRYKEGTLVIFEE